MSRPGKLRHRVEIWRQALPADTSGQDDYGQTSAQFAKVGDAWASIEPVSGEEYFLNAQVHAQVSHKVMVRGNISVAAKDEVRFNGRVFNVVSVLNMHEISEYKELMTQEKV